MIIETLLILAVVSGLIFFAHGFNLASLIGVLFVSILSGIVYYFDTKKSKAPTKTEKIGATLYLLFRRLICFSGAILFLGVAIKFTFLSEFSFKLFGLAIACLGMAGGCIWIGVYGREEECEPPKEDVKRHEQKKARYKWRW